MIKDMGIEMSSYNITMTARAKCSQVLELLRHIPFA